MGEPIVFVSHFEIKEGQAERFKELAHEIAAQLKADKPATLGYLFYGDAGFNHATIVHVFGDADSMDHHFEGAVGRAARAYELMQPAGWEIYGQPSDAALDGLRSEADAARVRLTVEPTSAGGFLRLAAR